MSKKRASRNNKKVLKALNQKRAKYNIGGNYGRAAGIFSGMESFESEREPATITLPDGTVINTQTGQVVSGDSNTDTTTTTGGGTTTTTGTTTGTTSGTGGGSAGGGGVGYR